MDLAEYVLLLNLFLDHLQWFRKSQEYLETANPVTRIELAWTARGFPRTFIFQETSYISIARGNIIQGRAGFHV